MQNANVAIQSFWHYKLSPKEAKCIVAERPAKLRGRKTKSPTLEAVWILKEGLFREFLFIDGIAQLNFILPYVKTKKGYIVSVPQDSPEFCGINKFLIALRGNRLLIDKKVLPLKFIGKPRSMRLELGSIVGGIGLRLCCSACYAVHDALDIHFLDCICCLGKCGYKCYIPIPIPRF